jgi:osmoprotectant transport system substrate-binding protein
MSISIRRRALIALGLFAALAGSASAQVKPVVRVGSKIDTEGSLLGNLILQALEFHGIKTSNKLQLGSTKVLRGAIMGGEIDLYPEYTGNGAFFFADEKDPAWKNAQQGYAKVKSLDFAQNKIVWLDPAPANNTWGIAVRQDLAAAHHLKSLGDLGKWINAGGIFKLAASAEFVERPDALPAFEKIYGFTLKQDQLLTLAGGDTAVTIKAAAEQTSGVNAAMAYGTDGSLAALGLVILEDNRGAQAIYAPTPIIRAQTLDAYPAIRDILKPLFQSLDGPTLQKLNARIAMNGEQAHQVAASYLKSKGFVN